MFYSPPGPAVDFYGASWNAAAPPTSGPSGKKNIWWHCPFNWINSSLYVFFLMEMFWIKWICPTKTSRPKMLSKMF